MTQTYLATKLYVPRLRAELVSRPHLVARINDGMSRKLTLICAPAGFGKTTLLSEWRTSDPWCKFPVAWLSLDEGDNDPARFWGYCFAALERLHAGVTENARTLLYSSPSLPIESVLTSLINALVDVDANFALVLDDYHVVESEVIHRGLIFLLDHLPPQMHVAIASRSTPPLALARLRGRNELTELGVADLRFLPDEVTAFTNRVMGISLADENLAALEASTEGWIVGLQLAALSMQADRDSGELVKSFTGSNRYVVDYFGEEVLNRQQERVRLFLLQTSILQRLTGPLCNALTGQGDGQAMLETLERANLLTVPLDNERRWYRYHHLFADFLRNHLRSADPGGRLEQELHRRAAEWCAKNGFRAEAIDHALAACDYERAGLLVEGAAGSMLMRGEVKALLGWLDALPDAVVCARPRLGLFHAWAMVLTVRLDSIEERLRVVEKALHGTTSSAENEIAAAGMLGDVIAIRAMAASHRRDGPRTLALCSQALQLLPVDSFFARGICAQTLGVAHRILGDHAAAIPAFTEAVRVGHASKNHLLSLSPTTLLAHSYERLGQLHRAGEHYLRALQVGGGNAHHRPLTFAGFAYIGYGRVLHQWNDLDGAKRHLEIGVQLGEQWPSAVMLVEGYISIARLQKTRRDFAGTLATIGKAEELVREHDLDHFLSLIAAVRAQVSVAQGDLVTARYWAEECLARTSSKIRRITEPAHAELARVLIAQGSSEDAISLLDGLQSTAKEAGQIGRVIEITALRALAMAALGDVHGATVTLSGALALAEPEGFVRTFVDKGTPMATLLLRMMQGPSDLTLGIHHFSASYVRKLLAAFGIDAEAHVVVQPAAERQSVVEPLSRRELEVLQLVEDGLGNEEIAAALVIATSTVKSHLKSIFAKMHVTRRTQAVARARELSLLRPKARPGWAYLMPGASPSKPARVWPLAR